MYFHFRMGAYEPMLNQLHMYERLNCAYEFCQVDEKAFPRGEGLG